MDELQSMSQTGRVQKITCGNEFRSGKTKFCIFAATGGANLRTLTNVQMMPPTRFVAA